MPEPRRTPLLLDTDIGSNVDDLLALVIAATAPEIELVGVTTAYGDTALRAGVAARVLELLGRDDVPVGVGAGAPRSGREVFWTGLEGTGMGALPPAPDVPADALFTHLLERHGSELVVAAIAPLTNVAGFCEHAAATGRAPGRLIIMGGQFGDGPPDRNVSSDAVAAQVVAAAPLPRTFVGIEVCRQVVLDDALWSDLPATSELGRIVATQIEAWWSHLGHRRSNPCDPLTLLGLIAPDVMTWTDRVVEVVTSGPTEGATRWRDAPGDPQAVRVAADVDASAARAEITRRVAEGLATGP